MNGMQYIKQNIRKLLHNLSELEIIKFQVFCYDNPLFVELYNNADTPNWKENFLNTVLDYVSEKKLEKQLLDWSQQEALEKYMINKPYENLTLPIAVITMTHQEALELTKESEALFEGRPDELQQWQSLWTALQQQYGETLKNFRINHKEDLADRCYDENRNSWKPLIGRGSTIETIIKNTITKFDDHKKIQTNYVFLSDDLFSEDWMISDKAVTQLTDTENEGVLIIDAISMYHPMLRKKLVIDLQILNIRFPISIIVISPFSYRSLSINRLLKEQIYLNFLKSQFKGFSESPDMLRYQFGVGGLIDLNRWLYSILELKPSINHVNHITKKRLREETAKANIKPMGMAGQFLS